MADLWAQALQAHQSGDLVQTYELCGSLLDAEPLHFGALNLLGAVALGLGHPAEALVFLDQALALIPAEPSALVNRGAALYRLGRSEEALQAYRAAVQSNPSYAHGWYNLGTALKELGRLDEARSALGRCVQTDPHYKAGHFNLANTLYELKQFEASLSCYDRAVDLDPQDAESIKNRAFARLMLGDFDRGWEDFEWRWRAAPLNKAWRDRGCPQWDGQRSLQDRTILIHAEQGLGDTLQFCRFVHAVKARGAAQVVFEVQKPLVGFLGGLDGADRVVPQGLALPACDFHIPLMSLPRALGVTPATMSSGTPYLRAPAERRAQWAPHLARSGFKIGICWQGSGQGKHALKTIPLSAFSTLAGIPGVCLFSLQKADPAGLQGPGDATLGQPLVHEFGPAFDREIPFADSAAVMMDLDLVITTDTSVAHLAGGLGVPVWTALPFLCDWRWGPQSGQTDWYPTMRLFRQHQHGDWTGCFSDIAEALRSLLGCS